LRLAIWAWPVLQIQPAESRAVKSWWLSETVQSNYLVTLNGQVGRGHTAFSAFLLPKLILRRKAILIYRTRASSRD